jgi:hypothetical protein
MWSVFIRTIKRKVYQSFLLALLLLGSTACDINQKEILPEDGFLKIYNHPAEHLAYYPESLVELPGGGFVFLSAVKDENDEVEYPYTNLVRTTASGEVSWSLDFDWRAPASQLMLLGGSVGFVAMNQNFDAFLILVNPANGEATAQHDLEMSMPLYAYADSQDKLVVLGYDFVTRSSWISKYSSSYQVEQSNKLPVNTDLEYLVQRHLNKTGQDYPFFIGEYSNAPGSGYSVNCFYNYTLRTVFLDLASLNANGDIYSFQTEEGISSVIQKGGTLFGLTSYYEGNNYVVPAADLNVNTSANIKDLPANPLYELTYRAEVIAGNLELDTASYTLFVSQTNDNSMVIYQYERDTEVLVNTLYRQFDQRVVVNEVIQTADKGIAIMGGIYILGKYQRPLLIKLDQEAFIPEE